jgi:hypothetical protein
MSLTINTTPNNIDNSGTFNVTTSLVEDSTHVNLRVRADVYHEGIIKAVVEKPKGIADFDFSDILKTLVPGLKYARNSGSIIKIGSKGTNLLTNWYYLSGTFATFSVSGNHVTIAEKTNPSVSAFMKSNDITVAIGEIYVFYPKNYVSSGAYLPIMMHDQAICKQFFQYEFGENKAYLFMPTTAGTFNVILGGYDNFNFLGDFQLYKITTSNITEGGLLVPYFISFTEVYEDSSGVTQTGTPLSSKLLRFVPASITSLTEYLLHDSSSMFANLTLRNNVSKFIIPTPYEYFLCFFSEYVELNLYYSKDGGGYSNTGQIIMLEGWGFVVLNIGNYLLSSLTSNLRLQIKDYLTSAVLSEVITIYIDSSQIDERIVLEFDGLIGGKEYLTFEGLKDQEFNTIRNYFSSNKKNRKLISADGICKQRLETLFKDQANTEYLKSLLISDNIKRLEASYATPTDVTIITDNVIINKGRELFTNQIDIEYEY